MPGPCTPVRPLAKPVGQESSNGKGYSHEHVLQPEPGLSCVWIDAVLAYVRTIGKPVVLHSADALKFQMAAVLRGVCLQSLAIRSAIERLWHHHVDFTPTV